MIIFLKIVDFTIQASNNKHLLGARGALLSVTHSPLMHQDPIEQLVPSNAIYPTTQVSLVKQLMLWHISWSAMPPFTCIVYSFFNHTNSIEDD